MFARRAVARFSPEPLDQGTLEAILGEVRAGAQMDGQSAEVELATVDQVRIGPSSIRDKAPHYLLAHTPQTGAGFANAGYLLQLADLSIQAQGFGSHWLGMANPRQPRPDFTVMLAFGATAEPPRRSEDEFKRLPLDRIAAPANAAEQAVARAVRVAPSGMNTQPWRIEFARALIRLIQAPRGAARLLTTKKYDKISLGIAARHASIALTHAGRQVTGVTATTSNGAFALELV
jgi:hypothetical protein